MNKIVVVGCGNVGMAYCYSILNQILDIDTLVLIDIDKEKLAGKILDLNHSLFNLNSSTKIVAGTYSDCSDADIVCITAGPSQRADKTSRMEDLYKANEIFKNIIPQIKNSGFNGIYLIASNPLDVMTYVTWKYADCAPSKIIGSGTLLDTARLRYVVSREYDKPINEVTGYVLGEHGDSQFVAWSTVNIDKLSEFNMNAISDEVRKAGFEVGKLQGFTCYGIGSALSRITRAILFDENAVLPVSTYNDEYGIFISTPSIIGKNGVIKNNIMDLENSELENFKNSVKSIKTAIGNL